MGALRLPLQGGLPPVGEPAGPVVEIGCDESGFSGSNLLDPVTPVITHASVDLSVGEAGALLGSLGAGGDEVKSGRVVRDPVVVAGLLAGLRGRASVHLVDKEFFLATRIVDLFLAEPSYAAGTSLGADQRPAAVELYRARSGAAWPGLLAAFVALVRVKRRREPDRRALERFLAARDALGVLGGLDRERVEAVLTRLTDGDESIPPPLEPMLPALAETVLAWSAGRRQVLVIHDEQSALTAGRLRRIQDLLAERAPVLGRPGGAPPVAGPATARNPLSPLAGLVTVDSRDDPRVQVADLLAGAARRDPTAPALQPFVSPTSLRA